MSPGRDDYRGRRSCGSPCTRTARRTASPACPGAAVGRASVMGLQPPVASFPRLCTTRLKEQLAVRLHPPPHLRLRRTGHSPILGGATTSQPDAPAAAGNCRRASGWANSRNPRKGGGEGRGPSSCIFETAFLVLDGPRAAVLPNAISGSF